MAHAMAYLYFFFNNAGLAGGLLYTNLLMPFLYIWLLIKKKQPVLLPVFILLIPYGIVHLILGVDLTSFLISNALFISTYVFASCFHYFIHHYPNLGDLFKRILIANFIFTLIACVVYFTPYREILWYMNKFTQNVEGFYRLSLLTFEASYYGQVFVPIAYYYFIKILLRQNTQSTGSLLVLVMLPLLLSLSIGVLGGTAISFTILFVIHYKKMGYKKNFFAVPFILFLLTLLIFLLLYLFKPDNALFVRIHNIYYGLDTSTKGRTTDSFGIAWMVAKERSIWFGSGLGQVKVLAFDVVKRHYNYWGDLAVVRIPNSVAETIAIFGIFGLIIRFGLIFYLFFKTKVLSNYYRTAIFLFIFIYQFTGSYITSAVEYVMWVIAFSSAFKQFDVSKKITPLLK